MTRQKAEILLRLDLPALAVTVPLARQAAQATLASRGYPAETIDRLALCLSELLTNAVNATTAAVTPRDTEPAPAPPGGVRVVVSRDEERLRLAVTDAAPGRPRVRNHGSFEENGRGVRLVQAISLRWGTRYGRRKQKTVWCDLPSHQTAQPTTNRSPVCHQIHGSSASR